MKPIRIAVFLMIVSHSLNAQKIDIGESRVSHTGFGLKNMKVSLYFVDTTTREVYDSIDLAELNPYNHISLRAISADERFNKVYEVTNRQDYEKLFPKKYREQWYDVDYIDDDNGTDSGYVFDEILNTSYDYTINRFNGYVAVSFSLVSTSKNDYNPNGAIGIVMVFDNKKNLIFTLENGPGAGEMAVSDDGRYLVYSSGCMGPDVVLIRSFIEVIEIKTNRVVFREEGVFDGPSGGYCRDIIQFSQNFDGGCVRDYYFNTRLNKVYSLYYNPESAGDRLTDITPEGVIYKDKNNRQFFLEFEKDMELVEIK